MGTIPRFLGHGVYHAHQPPASPQAQGMAGTPSGLPRVALHAAVRSIGGAPSDDAASHPHTPQVVENYLAGDLIVAQVCMC